MINFIYNVEQWAGKIKQRINIPEIKIFKKISD